jgi:hypothetical protein
MKKLLGTIVITGLIFAQSCKDDNDKLSFDVDIIIKSLNYYPNDSISMTFFITSIAGKSPYEYNWLNPNTFKGEGPFIININDDISIELEVVDANKTKVQFHYEILKDTLDKLKYDYRNAFIGFYNCEVKHRWVIDSNGTWITHYNIYQDTIEVIKNSNYKMINISSLTNLNFNFRDSTFMGYHTDGKLSADSIRYYYFATPAALSSWNYKGAKIK